MRNKEKYFYDSYVDDLGIPHSRIIGWRDKEGNYEWFSDNKETNKGEDNE